ncbi:hypothetical protein JE48_011670 [Vibrio cholerae O1 biovar El Tor]|nr:hypothetical protein JE48_011670 [Vibrio cholerae O1 biovar El Tor]
MSVSDLTGSLFVFASLITGIGALIQIYALAYMKEKAARFSFHLYLTLFMLAMLGVVVSDNSFTAVHLLGTDHHHFLSADWVLIMTNQSHAKMPYSHVLVTGAGGLALLAGLSFTWLDGQ